MRTKLAAALFLAAPAVAVAVAPAVAVSLAVSLAVAVAVTPAVAVAVAETPAAEADRVTSLPGYFGNSTEFGFSGYLNGQGQKKLHYWFFPAQSDPGNARSRPLALWLTGGPGCSSLDALLSENGPFHMNPGFDPTATATPANPQIIANPHTWTANLNLVFLEAPAGVGFSYSPDERDYRTDDYTVAADNFSALTDFFTRVFPRFSQNPFGVFGESYGGVYVPSLVNLILTENERKMAEKTAKMGVFEQKTLEIRSKTAKNTENGTKNTENGLKPLKNTENGVKNTENDLKNSDFSINLQFFEVGNPLSSYKLNDNAAILLGFGHNIISANLWQELNKECCGIGEVPSLFQCDFHSPTEPKCQSAVAKAMALVYGSGLNMYRLNGLCQNTVQNPSKPPFSGSKPHFSAQNGRIRVKIGAQTPQKGRFSPFSADFGENGPSREFFDRQHLFRNFDHPTRAAARLTEDVPCIDTGLEQAWLRREDVMAALHVVGGLKPWSICSAAVGGQYQRNFTDMTETYQNIFKLHPQITATIMSGNDDSACGGLGNSQFARDLNRTLIQESSFFRLPNSQIGGEFVEYANLIYVSVKGAGHMVPQNTPLEYPIGQPLAASWVLDNIILRAFK